MVEATNSEYQQPKENNNFTSRVYFFIFLFLSTCNLAIGQKLKEGKIAPEFVSKLLADSTPVRLSDFRGKVVLVDFWASWCSPCIENNEELVHVYLKYREKGFEIIAISFDEDKTRLLRHLKKYNYPWPVQLWEPSGFDSEPAITYNIKALPTSFLVDELGKIIWVDPDAYDVEVELKRYYKEK